jgi:hypothetical protein
MKKEYQLIGIVAIMVLTTAVWRVVNAEMHLYNLVPIAAMGLFSGSILQSKKWAYLIPLSAMLLSDIGLSLFTSTQGFYGISQIVNYVALAIVTLLGTRLVNRNGLNIAGYTIGGSILFFILSNFGTFLSGWYGYSFSSLVECYAMALPFYKSELSTTFFLNSLFGDLAFSAISFGLVYVSSLKKLVAKTA